MTRPIDADALIKKWENVHSKDMSFTMAIIGATNDVKKAPTIDAVPVIRCKSCTKNGTVYCAMAVASFSDMTGEVISWNEPDDHCSRAVRKEECSR